MVWYAVPFAALIRKVSDSKNSRQEDKVCMCNMNYNYLGRILTTELKQHSHVSEWMLNVYVDAAIRRAVRKVKDIDELLARMREGVVRFSYTKKNGETREAIGTLKQTLLLGFSAQQTKQRLCNSNCVTYYDIKKEEWRSFCAENFATFL